MEFLTANLPEDISQEIILGNFGKAINMINKKLQSKLPDLLKERLLYEKERMNRILINYPYSIDDAKKLLKKLLKVLPILNLNYY
nr:hypothetical protein [Marinitoga lauensis]